MFQWEVSTFWTNKSVIKCTYSERAIKIWRNLHILFEITSQRQKLFGHFRIYKLYLARLVTDFMDPFERIFKKIQAGLILVKFGGKPETCSIKRPCITDCPPIFSHLLPVWYIWMTSTVRLPIIFALQTWKLVSKTRYVPYFLKSSYTDTILFLIWKL